MTEPVKVVADILQSYMGLSDGQVMLSYQKYDIPTDGLFIVVTPLSDAELGRDSYLETQADGSEAEVTEVLIVSDIQIDIMSFDSSARTRRHEIMAAIGSIYSHQQQVANLIALSRNTLPMQDTTFLEETKNLIRYTTRLRAESLARVIHTGPDYYDSFTGQLNTDPVAPGPTEVDPAPLTA